MIDHRNRKKKLIISYKNLPEEVRELFKEAYPDGYKEYLQKTIKPNGEPIFVVPLETDDTSYMVKFDVKIDTALVEEDLDKDVYGNDDDSSETEFAPLSEALDKENGGGHTVGKLQHGAYEEIFEGLPEDKKEFEMANEDIEDEYGDRPDEDADDLDSYVDGEGDDDDDIDDDDIEPDDDELLDIENLLEEADAGEGMLREPNPPEEKRGRKKKSESAAIAAVKAVRATAKQAKAEKSIKTTKTAKAPKTQKAPKVEKAPKIEKVPKAAKTAKVTKAIKETPVAKATKVAKVTTVTKVAKATKVTKTAEKKTVSSPIAKKTTKKK